MNNPKTKMRVDPFLGAPELRNLPGLELHERMYLSGDPAAPAIAGIRQSAIADKLELFEKHYALEMKDFPHLNWLNRLVAWAFGFSHYIRALQIARTELENLALAHAETLNNENAKTIQADFYQQWIKLGGDLREFESFLFEQFRYDLEAGQSTNRNLFQIAKGIMLEQKKILRTPKEG
jgi:hypothetical protein